MDASLANRYAPLDAYVEHELLRLKVPGAALAVVECGDGDEGCLVHFRGFGRAAPAGPPPALQTPFFIGSVTKSFTALAVMQLVERGKIDLDAPVQRYLPWFRVADPAASAGMTVRHLLNQTSGFSMVNGSAVLGDVDDRPDACERQVRALSSYQPPRPPGAAFDYSNTNFNILGLIVEAVSGEPYADYVRNCIFNPLRMTHSYTDKDAARTDGLATGHRFWFWRPIPEPNLPVATGSLPAGQLISCAQDLAHYVIAHLNDGHFNGAHILSPAGMAEMHHGAVEIVEMGVHVGQYGMGWFVSEVGTPGGAQLRVVWHSGLVPDYSAFVALIPGLQKGLILLLNAGHFWMEPLMNEFGLGAVAALAGVQPAPSPLAWLRYVPRVMQALPLLPLLQIVGSAAVCQRWRKRGAPVGAGMLPCLLPDLAFMAAPLALRRSPLDRFLELYAPDVRWLARVCGGLAALCSAAGFLTAWRRGCRGS